MRVQIVFCCESAARQLVIFATGSVGKNVFNMLWCDSSPGTSSNPDMCTISVSQSWVTHTDNTQEVCPLSTVLQGPVLASHTRKSLSIEPEKSVSPSWDTYTEFTASVCPLSTFLQGPVLASHTRMSLSLSPESEKSVSPSWDTHTDLTD